jgi:hypothetical protein
MHPTRDIGGDGVSAPGLRPGLMAMPSLMVWPFGTMSGEGLEEIYRLALEWSQAALRPSAYERAERVYCN